MKQLTSNELRVLRKDNTSYNGPNLLLDNVSDPRNIGNILRLADAFGCNTVGFWKNMPDFTNPKLRAMSRGAEAYLDLQLIQEKPAVRLVAVEITNVSLSIFSTSLHNTDMLVVGNENLGISQEVLDLCDLATSIPMFGTLGSLNVANAVAVALFEIRRQQYASSTLANL